MSKVRYRIPTETLNEKYLMFLYKCQAIFKIILVSYSKNLPSLTGLFESVTGSLIVPNITDTERCDALHLELNTGIAPTCDWKFKIALVALLSSRDL